MAKVKFYRASYGTSAEIEGIWHKFYNEIEIELTDGDNVEQVKEKAWNTVKHEVEKQIIEVIGN